MTVETWDAEQAVTQGPLDDQLEGRCSAARYGVTGREEIAGEPLEVALSQEEPEPRTVVGDDDEWLLADVEWGVVESRADDGPESAAMHIVTP